MAYRNGHSLQTNGSSPHTNGHRLRTLHVYLTPLFTGRWGNGLYSGDLRSLEQYFGRDMRLGYLDVDEDRQTPRLRFPERNVIIPLHSRGSMTNVEADGFYHTRKGFQLGQEKTRPASINGHIIEPGVVRIYWKAMY